MNASHSRPAFGQGEALRLRRQEVGASICTSHTTLSDQLEKAELVGAGIGFIKFVVERSSRRLLGCHAIGRQAADLVWSASLVLRRRGTLDELAITVGIFPTLAEGMEGTARALLRRLAPELADRPLAVAPGPELPREVAMTASNTLECPACGAEFDVRERLEHADRRERVSARERSETIPEPATQPVSVHCPACGAEFEAQEHLEATER